MERRLVVVLVMAAVGGLGTAGAASAATPGWECVPTAAGQAVTSGGTGAAPSCGGGSTAVLAPSYVSSGVGGKPTVQFSGVNVQIVNGSGHTTTVNGLGNVVLGYDESPGKQTGSHDLILGLGQAFTSYGGIAAGDHNSILGPYASVTGGQSNTASGTASAVSGGARNVATRSYASASGGYYNRASSDFASVSGGCGNVAGTTGSPVAEICFNNEGKSTMQSVLGGIDNVASGPQSTVSGGGQVFADTADGTEFTYIPWGNTASGGSSSVSGGSLNSAQGAFSSILGGHSQTLTSNFWVTYPDGP